MMSAVHWNNYSLAKGPLAFLRTAPVRLNIKYSEGAGLDPVL